MQPTWHGLTWPANDYSRVPYGVFSNPEIYEEEQEHIFRGPVWININWITIYGLQKYGLEEEAAELRRKTMALIAKTDVLREYYNSQTGEGEGAQNFMWTASLFVAMALQDPA
mgnify:CR=1 FL=1